MKVAVIGGSLSGLAAAYILGKDGAEVVLYEKEAALGGQGRTTITLGGTVLDLGFMFRWLFGQVTHPDIMEFLEQLGVDMEPSDMSFSVSMDGRRGCQWGTPNGFSSLFA